MNYKEFIEKKLFIKNNLNKSYFFNNTLEYFLIESPFYNHKVVCIIYKNVFNKNIKFTLRLYEDGIITVSNDNINDPFFSSNFDELNINSLQELCLFCEKLLKNQVFL